MTDPGTTDGTTQTEGQTARDVFPEDDGIPETALDDSPTMQRAEDPQVEALPGESATATADFGTTAAEQAEGESLSGRLDRELPDDTADVDDPSLPTLAAPEPDEPVGPGPDFKPGDDPTKAPVMIRAMFSSVKPRAAAAQPE